MTKEQVELKLVKYAKSVDWDQDSIDMFISKKISLDEYSLLEGVYSTQKARNFIYKHKTKRGRPASDKTIPPGLRIKEEKWKAVSKKYKGKINKMFNDWIDTL